VAETQQGHLLLADISGYTPYVASTELSYSQDILSKLPDWLIERLKPLMTIYALEGNDVSLVVRTLPGFSTILPVT
jgi:hypothetical protein